MKAKHNLEHRIFESWKKKNDSGLHQKVMVGVSGGRDSMALLAALRTCFSSKNIVAVHVHHGLGHNTAFRDQAQELVENFCKKHEVLCETVVAYTELKSEAEFREFRLKAFQRIGQQYHIGTVALGHHRDDWLENQLLKLIRGSSFASLKKGFQWSLLKEYDLTLWRPLIQMGRGDLDAYRQLQKVPFVEDPSNQDARYLRNWLRQTWLPQLEHRRPGSVGRLAQSLIHSIAEITPSREVFPWDFKTNSIDLIYFLSLSEVEKLRCLAFFVHEKGLKSIRANQLKEVIRQLDKNSVHCHIQLKTFECLVNAGQLLIKERFFKK
ncbi:MAG: tRNA lysidine(34) synthetase TilS [Bdellovibrionaceae bacterium]|nr:tRNA lysidine(34) synthetase TilS [Pseudobdellovibrionaceae bacterium]